MKKEIRTKQAIFPMPVLMIATYNKDESVNVMNAAWGMLVDFDKIVINMEQAHKSYENVINTKAFTVSLADSKHVVEADFFGVVSGNDDAKKFEKSKLTATKSELVNAPIINEFPLCMECEFIEFQSGENGCGVVGKIKRVSVDEEVLKDNKVDVSKLDAIAYDSFTHGYYKIGERVGTAFKDGLKLKIK